ncbi:MAG TPA: ABC transporter permease [Acidimicrobiales bacterium]|nr:ABC transporter permease [Acidimicrobiales bacterium]
MKRLLRAELLKQRTAPAFLLAFAAVPVLAGLVTFATCSLAGRQGNDPLGPDSLLHAIGAPASVLTTLALLLGVVGMAGEYRHGTIIPTLLSVPRRGDLLVAKMAAHALTGASMAVVTLAVSLAIAVPWLMSAGVEVHVSAEVVRAAGALVASTALYGALGACAGALFRNQTAAVGVVLVWLLKGEDLLAGALARWWSIGDWLPFALGEGLVRAGAGTPARWAAALAFIGHLAGLAAVGAGVVARRDVT